MLCRSDIIILNIPIFNINMTNVPYDRQCYTKYSSHSVWMWGMICWIDNVYVEYSSYAVWMWKYYAKYCQSHKSLLWLWMMLCMRVGSWLFYTKIISRLVLRVGSSFLLDPSLNTSPKPRIQKCCHVGIHVIPGTLRLGTPCEVVNPNFHALNNWDCINRPQVTWDLKLRTWNSMWIEEEFMLDEWETHLFPRISSHHSPA